MFAHTQPMVLVSCQFLFGVLTAALGMIWNAYRFQKTKQYSPKYRTICIIGLFEILASLFLAIF
jgi:hypothetical protein